MTTTKYEFDAVRWCRTMGDHYATRTDNDAMAKKFYATADEIQRLRAEADTLRNESRVYRAQCDMANEWRDKIERELGALKDAARPIAQFWKGGGVQGVVRGTNPPLEEKYLDELAALVGEG